MERLGPRRTGVLFAINAPLAAFLAWLTLNEELTFLTVFAIVIGAASEVANRAEAEEHARPPSPAERLRRDGACSSTRDHDVVMQGVARHFSGTHGHVPA